MPSVKRRILAGCLVLTGIVLVAAVIAFWLLSSWITREARLPEGPHPFLAGDELRFLTWTADAADPGQQEILATILESLAQKEYPPEMALWKSILEGLADEDPNEVLGQFLPIQHASLVRPGPGGGAGASLLVTSFTRGYGPLLLILNPSGQAGAVEEPFGDLVLIHVPEPKRTHAFVESHWLRSRDPARVRDAIQRYEEHAGSSLPGKAVALAALVEADAPDTDLWGFSLDASDLFRELEESSVEQGGPPLEEEARARLQRIGALAIAVDFETGDRMILRVVARFRDGVPEPEREAMADALLVQAGRSFHEDLRFEPQFEWIDELTLKLQAKVTGLGEVLRQTIREMDLEAAAGDATGAVKAP